MRCFTALGLLVAAAGLAQPAAAADYGAIPYAPASASAPIVELGSGWYLRGDLGAGIETRPPLIPNAVAKSSDFGWTGDVGFGYKFTSYLRTDLTLGYFKPTHLDYSGSTTPTCPYTLTTISNQATQLPVGFSYAPIDGTCQLKGSADLAQVNALANVYADLGTYFGITPYVGGGVGVSQIKYSGSSNYYKTSDGSVYNTDLTPSTGGFPLTWVGTNPNNTYYILNPQPKNPRGGVLTFGPQDYSRSFSKTKYSIAFALMAGFAYAVTDQASIDVGYRYVNNGTFVSMPGANNSQVKKALETQQVRVGFRYQID